MIQKYIIKIDKDFLQSIHTGHYHTPTVYFHANIGVRWLFWERFNQISKLIIKNNRAKRKICLDFGGGAGVFLPTLSKMFDKVILVDLEPSQALIIKEKFKLDNCEILKENIFDIELKNIDVVIAADVIEHFNDTLAILKKLQSLMSKDSFLYTSLPTENGFYAFLRKVFKEEKPIDHYYGAYEIEDTFLKNGMLKQKESTIPLPKPFDLFKISEWKLA